MTDPEYTWQDDSPLPPSPAERSWLPAAQACIFAVATICASQLCHAAGTFSLKSENLHDGGTVGARQVFDQGECHGGNHSPQLSWSNAPDGTRSFAVTVFDPDAPGHGWWHWAAAGIPARVSTLPENASASGYLKQLGAVEARNDFGLEGYSGPCPPPGKPHRYVVTVYALGNGQPGLTQGRPAATFDHAINAAALGSAKLTVTYGR